MKCDSCKRQFDKTDPDSDRENVCSVPCEAKWNGRGET